MIFTETIFKGSYIIELEKIIDERGYFARSFCKNEFSAHGLKTDIVQCNISFNSKKGTLRGMHMQLPPKAEAKLIRCTKGRIYDVIIDLRSESETYCKWLAIELTEEKNKAIYVPEGFAHGFQTLEENSEVFYHMFEFYDPGSATGVRWDDQAFCIEWPLPNPLISEKDASYPLYKKVFS
jgi:dTDP-4-dehydrorhamnose 3,5-epimerase